MSDPQPLPNAPQPPSSPAAVAAPPLPPAPQKASGWRPMYTWILLTIGLVIVLAGGCSYLYVLGTQQPTIQPNQPDKPSKTISVAPRTPQAGGSSGLPTQPSTTQANKPARTVDQTGGLKLTKKSAFSCTANAPADWSISSNQESNSADLYSPDKSLYAGFGIQAVNTAIAPYAQYYQAPLNDPDLYSTNPGTVAKGYGKAVLASLGDATNLQFTTDENETVGEYSLRSVASSTHKGILFYHTKGIAGDGVNYSYAEPMYFAFTTKERWDSDGLLVAHIAASIQCHVNLVQHFNPYDSVDHSSSSSSKDSNGDTVSETGYNVQLGTEEVHDPTTGENYLVEPAKNWSESGPDGPGYYIPKSGGNDYLKLEPGRVD